MQIHCRSIINVVGQSYKGSYHFDISHSAVSHLVLFRCVRATSRRFTSRLKTSHTFKVISHSLRCVRNSPLLCTPLLGISRHCSMMRTSHSFQTGQFSGPRSFFLMPHCWHVGSNGSVHLRGIIFGGVRSWSVLRSS
jgi:hypothetical protein